MIDSFCMETYNGTCKYIIFAALPVSSNKHILQFFCCKLGEFVANDIYGIIFLSF